jgi:hypothetical protein
MKYVVLMTTLAAGQLHRLCHLLSAQHRILLTRIYYYNITDPSSSQDIRNVLVSSQLGLGTSEGQKPCLISTSFALLFTSMQHNSMFIPEIAV